MAKVNSYEEQRRRQMEENKRKMDELQLHRLSAAVSQAAAKPMPTKLVMPRNPTRDAPSRRSGRIASLPKQPDYHIRKKHGNVKVQERAYAITKAQELKDQLGSDHPTFIKPLSHAYATNSAHLRIPVHYRRYLPVHDGVMVFVDEMNNEFDTLFRCHKPYGQSLHRWKRFAVAHKLADGDCLVFQLIEEKKFKVYIIRASSYNKNDH